MLSKNLSKRFGKMSLGKRNEKRCWHYFHRVYISSLMHSYMWQWRYDELFLDQELISYHCLLLLLLAGATSSKKLKAPSFQIGSGWNLSVVLHVNKHRSTESDFRYDVTLSRWRPWRHFKQKSAAAWRVNPKRLLVYPASSWRMVHSNTCYIRLELD